MTGLRLLLEAETLEFVSIVPWQLIFQWCNLLILFLLVKKFLFKPVKAILAKREAEITGLYDEANQAKQQAESLREQYEQQMQAAKQEAEAMIRDAAQKAQSRGDQMVADAQKKAADLLERADREIALEQQKARSELKDQISNIAVDIASKVVEREVSAKDHKKLIEEFIQNVGDAS